MDTSEPRMVVLVIEDEASMHEFMVDFHREAGIKVHDAVSVEEALIAFQAHPNVQAMVSGTESTSQVDRFELAREIRERWPNVWPVITLVYQNPEPEFQLTRSIFVVKAHLLDVMLNVARRMASPLGADSQDVGKADSCG